MPYDVPFEYKLTRSVKRRSVELLIRRGQLEVKAPYFVSRSEIEAFIQRKQGWIAQKLALSQQHVDAVNQLEKKWQAGEIFQYLGNDYTLQLIAISKRSKVILTSEQLVLEAKQDQLKDAAFVQKQLTQWYKNQAQAYFAQRVSLWSDITGLHPAKVSTRKYKRRWGSCNARQEVSFNWLLMIAPEWVIDYVIVHELCHIAELNHSARFWQLVEYHYPEYKRVKLWLKQYGHTLTL